MCHVSLYFFPLFRFSIPNNSFSYFYRIFSRINLPTIRSRENLRMPAVLTALFAFHGNLQENHAKMSRTRKLCCFTLVQLLLSS